MHNHRRDWYDCKRSNESDEAMEKTIASDGQRCSLALRLCWFRTRICILLEMYPDLSVHVSTGCLGVCNESVIHPLPLPNEATGAGKLILYTYIPAPKQENGC